MKNKKLILFLLALFTFANPAFAKVVLNDFIIAGGTGDNSDNYGTESDEYALVGMIADKIVPNGAHFCPYQLQCSNKNRDCGSKTLYYEASGYSENNCVWLCKDGYSGKDCGEMPKSEDLEKLVCDSLPQNTAEGGRFSGLDLTHSGINIEDRIQKRGKGGQDGGGNCKNNKGGEREYILGITGFKKHGVIAEPILVGCYVNGYKNNRSWVNLLETTDEGDFFDKTDLEEPFSSLISSGDDDNVKVLLCAAGYKYNDNCNRIGITSEGCDCEPVDVGKCELSAGLFCDGFPYDTYNASKSQYGLTYGDTAKCFYYTCNEKGKAFANSNTRECTDCYTNSKNGKNLKTGVCVKCERGEFFNDDKCEPATVFYDKNTLQYGKNHDSRTQLSKQCWTKISPTEYKDCVINNTDQ